ncbi:MAG: sigma-70 family RNA polymerase sigma factor [Candidatus Omnitrophica bacterium]|nr:sigma-70 family RNA polymerase sigma factor [Candidatus Omnitrophota bacterium]
MERQSDLDRKLVERARGGDARAFRELFDKYEKRVYVICYGIVRHREDALDLVQETFIKTYKSLAYFRHEANFYTWLYRIASNSCLDFLRKRKREKNPVPLAEELGADPETGDKEGAIVKSTDNPRETVVRKELAVQIEAAIQSLPPDHRSVVLLREVEKLSYDEIAKILGIQVGTVMSRLFYARKKLAEKLKGT